jgi:hypothetical protein
MKSYLLKLSASEEGPYGEAQIAQMFADGRIDRNHVSLQTAVIGNR